MLLASRDEPDAPPRPPKQGAPWTPPETTLPRFLLSATSALFEQGLADPRGCEYREIQLEADRDQAPDPRAGRPAMHGWVLPETAKGGPRRAVGWDGLIHPLASVGAEADLEADVCAMAAPVSGRAGFPRRESLGD